MKILITTTLFLLPAQLCSGAEAKSAKLTVTVRGVISNEDATAIQATLESLNGVQVKKDAVRRGERGRFKHFFTPPFVIELSDVESLDVGGVAEAVSKTKTPSRSEISPSLNLVLYSVNDRIDEEDIMALRAALADVNGVEPRVPGGIGGVLKDARLWVRLEAAGGAQIEFIQKALNDAKFDHKLLKP